MKPHLSAQQIAALLLDSMRASSQDQPTHFVDLCAALAQAGGHPVCDGAAAKSEPALALPARL